MKLINGAQYVSSGLINRFAVSCLHMNVNFNKSFEEQK